MPTLANMTVKKYDGTTDVVYYASQRASGEAPAVWVSAVGSDELTKPNFRILARDVSKSPVGAGREIRFAGMFPQTANDSTTGVLRQIQRGIMTASFYVPRGYSDAFLQEMSAQFPNLLAHALSKDSILQRYAPA
jgi:hypothetical protein